MIRCLALCLMCMVSSFAYSSSYYLLPILSVYDGDTINTEWNRLPEELKYVSIRVRGIDTPELAAASYYESGSGKLGLAKCHKEAVLAMKAKQALVGLIGDKKVMKITNLGWGSFPKRFVADVKINGKDVATFLINNGYAVYDDGKTSKDNKDWCTT